MYGNNKIFRYKLVIFIRVPLLHTNHLRKKQKALSNAQSNKYVGTRVVDSFFC